MPDERLMTIGGVFFIAGAFAMIAISLLAPFLFTLGFAAGAVAVAGLLLVLAGGITDEARPRITYLRRTPIQSLARAALAPTYCHQCGTLLMRVEAAGRLFCSRCNAVR